MEDYSNYTVVHFLSKKSDAVSSIPEYVNHIETVHQPLRLKNFRSDNGGEYTSDVIRSFFKTGGITHETTAPYTPEQNSKSGRLNQIILQISRTLLKYAGMPNRYPTMPNPHLI
ncbi:Similar to Retrovirus-related Pol polyprotein from transposon TNT 1-94; acc. no. P10978 [Pyronema omphalodes CBS 100304]|uniref:Similar to Retrovirus-related Pol polyprotein from transposon TNT 1-94 acc. no. P10978 n=1 Tax=Pyronema omphalodes (strain CBS 100304) TaxID=1076935 RepID=U4L228_PYROM|nr:Similar to Retrovirus-related Pol polyprotein from transposon TNT 1-94; acc. no. P10978 [Pyronema omphalodes CBS 100304]